MVGCSNNAINSPSDDKVVSVAKISKARFTKEVVAVGVASVAFGSIAIGDNGGRGFHTSNEKWFQKDSKYAGMDKMGHAWYGNTIADFFFERHPEKMRQPKRTAALASTLSFGVMSLVEIADGFADTTVGFSAQDMVANAAGAAFSYLRNTRPGLKKLVDYRIEYLPNYTKDDFEIDTFYADQKYLLAWKLSGIDALKDNPLRFFEVHTGYYARGYSSKEVGEEKQRNGYVGVGLNLSEVFGLGGSKKSGSKRFFKHFFEHIQLPKTSLEAVSF